MSKCAHSMQAIMLGPMLDPNLSSMRSYIAIGDRSGKKKMRKSETVPSFMHEALSSMAETSSLQSHESKRKDM